mmetsp:Transcript_39677/g.89959  ORF Transcript_39677/g.89959 Transcript_39677/m.89959 type:complete len:141 (-) Transcript_39677:418-840(-)
MQQRVLVTVPPNAFPGMQLQVNVNGQMVLIMVPQGVVPGQQLQVNVPMPAAVAHAVPSQPAPQRVRPSPPVAPPKREATLSKFALGSSKAASPPPRAHPPRMSAPAPTPKHAAAATKVQQQSTQHAGGEISALWWLNMGI